MNFVTTNVGMMKSLVTYYKKLIKVLMTTFVKVILVRMTKTQTMRIRYHSVNVDIVRTRHFSSFIADIFTMIGQNCGSY